MQSTMMSYPLTLPHLLERAGRYFANSEIVSRLPDRSLHRTTYGDFYRRARALAMALTQAGMKRGDRVATLMWNHYAHLEAYFGVPVAGGVVHTLNLRLHPDDIAYIVNDAQDRFLIVDDVLLPLFEQFKDRVSFERVFVVPLTGKPIPPAYESYEELLKTGALANEVQGGNGTGTAKASSSEFSYPELDENEPAAMCYTSGTTGRPPGVVFSHRSIVLHSYSILLPDSMGASQCDTVMPVVPMFHVLSWGIPHALAMVGSKLVFPGPHLDAESLLELIEGEQVTFAAGVPTLWLALLQLLEREAGNHKLAPGLQLLVGGSAAPEAMIRAYDRLGIEVVHAWGMTELSPVGTISRLRAHMRGLPADERYAVRATQGTALPFVDLRVVGGDGRQVLADGKTMGELQARGPFVTGRYHNRECDPEKFTADGWLRTGDVATVNIDGYIKICDRTKDLIKSGGEWISSVDLENAIMGHPAVAEAAVIAMPHPKWDERPLACIVLKQGATASAEDIERFIADKFAKWWLPDRYMFVDAIPRTSTGKFLKRALRQRIAAEVTAGQSEPSQ
ncbi:MAG: long-chain fatty acid--CoA ligase [Candidatus Korobacteraceae bacterium]